MKKKKNLYIPSGALFTVSSGVYSDYTIHGIFKAIKNIDGDALLEEYLKERPEEKDRYHFNEHEFLAWIYKQGFMKQLVSSEWFLGDYGDPSMMELHTVEYDIED